MLNPIVNDTRRKTWCGPGAVCLITGWPLSAVHELLPKRTMGAWFDHLEPVFEAAGWEAHRSANDVVPHDVTEYDAVRHYTECCAYTDRPTLGQWLRNRERRGETDLVLIGSRTTLHWIVVTGNRAADQNTGRAVPTREFHLHRARVQKVYRMERVRSVPTPPARSLRSRTG